MLGMDGAEEGFGEVSPDGGESEGSTEIARVQFCCFLGVGTDSFMKRLLLLLILLILRGLGRCKDTATCCV